MKIFATNGNLIGELKEGILYKKVKKSVHLFGTRSPFLEKKFGGHAWGIDNDALFNQLPADGKIVICELEEMKKYVTTVQKWREEGVFYHFNKDKENGPQCFLPINKFEIKDVN